MSLPLELGGIQDPDVRRAFEQVSTQFPLRASALANDVLVLAVSGTSRRVAFGTGTVTFSTSTVSATLTLTHGLGVTPQVVLAGGTSGDGIVFDTFSYTSTDCAVRGSHLTAALNGTFTFVWVAIG